jgi:DNA-directed RNA polymerase delta subunit
MIQDLSEFELNFIDFATVVSMARTVIRQKYRDMSYNELMNSYDKIFGEDYEV